MNKVGKQDLIEAYESIEVSLQQRIALTPVSQFKQLLHDFTQLYRTKGKLARLKGVSVNG
ncbi:hypothetical protein [Levilactobacillus brevis]|uniref:Uncharacterized protein n=2 Tax=Levilactobacillus brevis TaxID=1580 RepID=Q03RA9_LEVBA|nr:hypothetical protein [Levilactobacillus brevis]ABJ64263.1 hypothetical protein LVIS_1134 [Levilactobacillus brevis ATCC 367]AWP46313.1 hypothetical protein CCS05_04990 [Levilactobacillus brevis]KWT47493.1 hypothetical protein ABB39_08750 [Levilactobacillus brevis]MBT9677971.1 hypothetical protein [Levilactobacillus brevis]PBQ23393.1 hypothetical protein CNR29_04990 [Levilactobacillus brevis]